MRGLAAATLVLAGCTLFRAKDTRPPLPPPMPPHAPYEHRYAHYVNARAVKADRDYLGFSLQRSSYSPPYLMLGNGRKVYDVDELGPHVGPGSDLGKTIATRKRAQAKNRRIWIIGGGAILAGAAFFTLGGLTVKNDSSIPSTIGFTLGAVGLFGGLGYWTFVPRPDEPDVTIDGDLLKTYNGALAEHLRLCVDGFYFTTCEAPPSAAPYVR